MNDDDFDDDPECDDLDFECDDSSEPIGSCDECECDVFEDDVYYVDGEQLCSRCAWVASGCPEPGDIEDDES